MAGAESPEDMDEDALVFPEEPVEIRLICTSIEQRFKLFELRTRHG